MSEDDRQKPLFERLKMAAAVDWRRSSEEVRKRLLQGAQLLEPDPPNLLEVRDLAVAGAEEPLKARLYVPFAPGARGPGLIFLHGGAFLTGDLDSHDMICRRLADAAHVRVLAIAYRLAPEHKFPAAPLDVETAARWAFAHADEIGFDAAHIAIGGDSAGGNLATVTAQTFKRDGGPALRAQLLIYPCTQFVQLTPSQLRGMDGSPLAHAAQDLFLKAYFKVKTDAYDLRASPLLADDLAGLPPTYLVTAAYDTLLDEGRAYGEKLSAAGVPVTHRHYQQMHGFFSLGAISVAAREAIVDAGRWLGALLGAL